VVLQEEDLWSAELKQWNQEEKRCYIDLSGAPTTKDQRTKPHETRKGEWSAWYIVRVEKKVDSIASSEESNMLWRGQI
jgi:hypothetical protein